MSYILAVDLGSTQMKLMLMDESAKTVCVVAEKYPTYVNEKGWMEQKPADWLFALKKGVSELSEAVDIKSVEVISFSGHMSSVVLMDDKGEVLYPCIMLSDSRSQRQCDELERRVGPLIKERTGNTVNNAFSLPKLLWLYEEKPDIYAKTKVWVSAKDYLRYCLTGVCETEYTDAYNSLCTQPGKAEWDEEIIAKSGLDKEMFPTVRSPYDRCGSVTKEAAAAFGLKAGIPVVAGAADMACAALGAGLWENGDSALTLGTCATYLSVVPGINEKYYGQITFHPCVEKGKMFALGSHFNGGAAVNWISGILSEKGQIDYEMLAKLSKEAESVPAGSGGMITIPFLAGSGSPYFCASDRQHVIGMRMNTTRAEVFRSELEGITYNLRQTFEAFREMSGVSKILLGGGGVRIGIWPQIIADIFGIPADISQQSDVSTVGAAIIAGVSAGIFKDAKATAENCLKIQERKDPSDENKKLYDHLYDRYLNYYKITNILDSEDKYGR